MNEDRVLEISLLGRFQIKIHGEPVFGFESDKVRGLLAYLVVESEKPHSRSALAGLFWPDRPEVKARKNLSQALSNLRTVIGDRSTSPPYLLISHQSIQFNTNSLYWLDIGVFKKLVGKINKHEHVQLYTCSNCIESLERSASLGIGEFLEGFTLPGNNKFDDWYLIHREKLHRQRTAILNSLVHCYSHQGIYNKALNYAWELLDLDRWREETYQHLMRLLALMGHRSASLEQYEICCNVLKDAFEVTPNDETIKLFDNIRTGVISPSSDSTHYPSQTEKSIPPMTTRDSYLNYQLPVFIGRKGPLENLFQTLSRSRDGSGQVVFMFGGPGRGKTALAHEFTRLALERYPELLVANGSSNAFSGAGDPFLPFREILAVLTGDFKSNISLGNISHSQATRIWNNLPLITKLLVTEGPYLIDTLVPGANFLARVQSVISRETGWMQEFNRIRTSKKSPIPDLAQVALLEQCAVFFHSLSIHHPLLIVLDDLQWVDQGSINLLFHLGKRLVNSRVMILGAYRPEEVHIGRDGVRHPLDLVLAELKRSFGETWLDLSEADQEDGRSFVAAFLDTELNRFDVDFQEKFFQRTQGHPLFTIELLRDMQARGDLVKDIDGFWIPAPNLDWNYLPGKVEAVIASRVDRLGQRERSFLEAASVEGSNFTAEVAGRVERLPPKTIFEILDQDCRDRHRLVKDLGDKLIHGRTFSQYKFNHPTFNTYIYQSLSSGKRRFLHGEVAKALETLYGEHKGRIVVELAHHYDAAGNLKKAIPYLLAAGKQAQTSHAHVEATAYFNRVLHLLDFKTLTQSDKNLKLQALIALGVIFMNTGQIGEAETHLNSAIALGKAIQIPLNELIIIYHWLGEVYIWQNRPEDRIRLGREGLTLLGENTESKETALMNQAIAMGYWMAGDRGNFKLFTLQTAKFLQELPHSTELSLFYIHIAIMYTEEKEFSKAMRWLTDLEIRAIENNETRYLGDANAYMGDLLFEKGDLTGSLEKFQLAQELFNQIGDRGQEPGGSLSIMGWIYFSMGDLQNAAKLLEKSVEIAKDVGVNRWIAKNLRLLAHIFIAQGNLEDAEKLLWIALDLLNESKDHLDLLWTKYFLGRVYLKEDNYQGAIKQFQELLHKADTGSLNGYQIPDPHIYYKLLIGPSLNGFETVCEYLNDESKDESDKFLSFCQNLKNSNKELEESPFVQWYLEPVNLPTLTHRIRLEDDLFQPFELGWTWHDSMGDCSFSHDNGFLIHAANGRDLWYLNLSAPRIIRPAEGDLTIQTFCSSGFGDRPTNGGLLLWVDEYNYLTLDRGRRSANEISFQGCVDNQDFIIGRGLLQIDDHDEIYLRIDRSGEHVNAYCSSDGQDWFTVGYCRFPNQDQVQVGLFANGKIPREIYCGSFPNGTAIRFQKFWFWGEESANIDQNAQR